MRILGLDTSGKAVSVAVVEDGKLCSEFWLRHGKTHAEALMPCIKATLRGLDAVIGDFDAFAVITGPGSFTGLRIGIAAAKAFAYANNAGTVGIMTLDALAKNLESEKKSLICPIIDARNGNVYQAIYRTRSEFSEDAEYIDDGLARIAKPELLSLYEAAVRIKSALEQNTDLTGVVFNGDAATAHIDYFRAELSAGPNNIECGAADESNMLQKASSAAMLAYPAAAKGLLTPPESLLPEYMNMGYIKKY